MFSTTTFKSVKLTLLLLLFIIVIEVTFCLTLIISKMQILFFNSVILLLLAMQEQKCLNKFPYLPPKLTWNIVTELSKRNLWSITY